MDRQEEALKAIVGLKRVNAHLESIMRQDVHRHNLNVNEFAVLELLYHKGRQQVQAIKEKILVANSSTTYLLNKLCEKELCFRQIDENDKRITYIDLTETGKKLMAKIFPEHARVLESAVHRLSDGELTQLRFLLKKISGLT
ncbi:MarR family transcriptional regulator [Streptococcus minor]|uniref:MarR family transcriptional regulator n=1 Tax=Streptococcus minor TaxID=229549 RepID=A0A3P1VG80_9STRE|nr:MarR family transcriptional regulator [Streptococcus minor]RRD31393.1 MarR family transcriptional regulator [Streptococcus minor]